MQLEAAEDGVYGRGIKASWPKGIVAPFIETAEAARRARRLENQPGIAARGIETR
jgi:hypothetical protein